MISVFVALLEQNRDESRHGKHLLRYVATSSDQADLLLGKALYEDMKGVRLVEFSPCLILQYLSVQC